MYRRFTPLVFTFALIAVFVPPGRAQESVSDETDDLEKLQGVWKAVMLEADGRPRNESVYSGTTVTIEGDMLSLGERGQEPARARIKLYPTTSPKGIDWIMPDGPREGETLKGVYELHGDDLKICFGFGGERPTEVATHFGDNTEMFTLKRLPSEKWERFKAAEDGYSVEMPGEPEARHGHNTVMGFSVDVTTYVVRSDRERISYLAMGYKPPISFKNVQEMLLVFEVIRDQTLRQLGGEVISERDLEFEKGAAREFLIKSPSGAEFRARIYLLKDRVYFLQVVGIEGLADNKNVERFLNSLELLEQ